MFLLNRIKRRLSMPILPMLITVLVMGLCGFGALYAVGIMIGAQNVLGISMDPMVDVIGVGFLQGCALLSAAIFIYYLWVEFGLEYWLSHSKKKNIAS